MDKTFVTFNIEIGAEAEFLSFLRKNASEYKMLGAFPVLGVYDIVGKFQGARDEVYRERVLDMKRKNNDIRATLTLGELEDVGFEKEEDATLGKKSFCLINTQIGQENEVVKQLDAIEGVTEVHPVYGVYDIVAKYEAKFSDELESLLNWQIRKIPDIRSTLKLRVVEGGFIVDDKGNIIDYIIS